LKAVNNGLGKITDELTVGLRLLVNFANQRLSISQQWAMLGLSRSTYDFQPVGESAQIMALIERIDRLFTARPELGVRQYAPGPTLQNESLKRFVFFMPSLYLALVFASQVSFAPATWISSGEKQTRWSL
jgi:hypothetical protein